MRKSLAEYSKSHPTNQGGRICWACTIPQTQEINEARRSGVSLAVIRQWLLDECGYDEDVATHGRMHGHFDARKHHIVRKKTK